MQNDFIVLSPWRIEEYVIDKSPVPPRWGDTNRNQDIAARVAFQRITACTGQSFNYDLVVGFAALF
jgi:hypothetical protein